MPGGARLPAAQVECASVAAAGGNGVAPAGASATVDAGAAAGGALAALAAGDEPRRGGGEERGDAGGVAVGRRLRRRALAPRGGGGARAGEDGRMPKIVRVFPVPGGPWISVTPRPRRAVRIARSWLSRDLHRALSSTGVWSSGAGISAARAIEFGEMRTGPSGSSRTE